MNIVVYGNCQATSIGVSIGALLPGIVVTSHHYGIGEAPSADGADLIFAQPAIADRLGVRDDPRVRLIPPVMFTGFHPDCTIILRNGKALKSSPVGTYTSSLVAACFLKDVAENEVPSWFNSTIFEAVGFYSEFARAKKFLLQTAQTSGFDLTPLFEEWTAGERPFMHTLNHPKIGALHDVCRLVLVREGFRDLSLDGMPADPLSRFKWPVYPTLAGHLGIAEEPLFTVDDQELSLPEFVAGSYEAMRDLPREAIAETRAVMRVLAGLEKTGL